MANRAEKYGIVAAQGVDCRVWHHAAVSKVIVSTPIVDRRNKNGARASCGLERHVECDRSYFVADTITGNQRNGIVSFVQPASLLLLRDGRRTNFNADDFARDDQFHTAILFTTVDSIV